MTEREYKQRSPQAAAERIRAEPKVTPEQAQKVEPAKEQEKKRGLLGHVPQRLRSLADQALTLNRLGTIAMGRVPSVKNLFDRGR